MSRVTVIGSGFAALTAVRQLRRANADLGIDVVSPKPELVYYPGTIWIPTGKRRPEDLVAPLEGFFKRMRVDHHATRATGLSDDARTLHTEAGEIANDGLVIACGGQFLRKLPGIEHSFLPCCGPQEIARLGDRLQAMESGSIAFGFAGNPKEPSAMRGGPVFEFLFGIDTWLRKHRRRENFTLHFFSPAEKPGQRLGGKAVERLLDEMKKRGIRTHLGQKPKRFSADGVETEAGSFAADLILFMPGMTGNDWFDDTPLPRSDGGMIRADEHCRVAGFERVYVAGDAGSFPGPGWMPKQAHMADLQAEAAARNLLAELGGKPAEATFKSELMCIVDLYDRGILVTRSESGNRVLPPLRAMHWAKRLFEWRYLRQYR
ncbi:MAG: FAD/NAD(P)-binding oxidoreductase [Wenzhouxiangella sp.]|jgi:sulfide:quinone oxidoreductase|nr:FAD/NAD(P)-binding oxidoreductase [Wenzhouxiangella sp.]